MRYACLRFGGGGEKTSECHLVRALGQRLSPDNEYRVVEKFVNERTSTSDLFEEVGTAVKKIKGRACQFFNAIRHRRADVVPTEAGMDLAHLEHRCILTTTLPTVNARTLEKVQISCLVAPDNIRERTVVH